LRFFSVIRFKNLHRSYRQSVYLPCSCIETEKDVEAVTGLCPMESSRASFTGVCVPYIPVYAGISRKMPGISLAGREIPWFRDWCRRGGLPGDTWDVVSPDGEFLREVHAELPDSAYFIDMDVSFHGTLAFDMFTQDFHRLYMMK